MLTNHWALSVPFLLVLLANGCKPAETPDESVKRNNTMDFVMLSSQELSDAGLSTGTITIRLADRYIECIGMLELPYSSVIQVAPLASGILKNVTCIPGSYAEKGTVLAELESLDFLKLQQAYLEAKNQLEYNDAALKRQGELTMENASSIKKLQEAQRDYQDNEIKTRSLCAQLTLMGIETDSLDIDRLVSTIEIKAPISGYVSIIYGIPGEFISTGAPLFEMTSHGKPQLILQVPETYFQRVQPKQMLNFSIVPGSPLSYRGKLVSIGRRVDPVTKTFSVKATLINAPQLVPGTSVYARIITGKDSIASIHSAAIINDHAGQFIFIKKGLGFKRVVIHTGDTDSIYTELIKFQPEMIRDSIVTAGTEYLLIRMNRQRNIQ